MTGETAIIGLVVGVAVAAVVVLGVHWRGRRSLLTREQEHGLRGQGGAGIAADPGQSRPAGPDAEAQAPDRSGNVGAPEGAGSSERER